MSDEPSDGRCPVCGSITNAAPGTTVPMHQTPGTRETCPGSGGTAQ